MHLRCLHVIAVACCLLLSNTIVRAEPDEVMVPMRDEVELATDIYLPEGDGPWPCILSRTPYNKNGNRGAAEKFAEQGYAFVSQDCRGRFKSKGKYDPFKTDHHDGYDMVEWVAAQEWSNGKVGMLGGSAVGITSNLAATQTPPHLKCAFVIVAPASARRNTVYMGGVYRKEMNDGWLTTMNAAFAIDDTMQHPAGTSYWDWREITDFHNRIDIPICNVGGWFDIFAQGTIDNFVGLQEHGAGLAAGNQKLIMGPYAHGQTGGRLKFPGGERGVFDFKFQLRWFDHWLKGIDNGIDREPPVSYYLMGATEERDTPGNVWKEAEAWPPLAARPQSFFISADRILSSSPPDSAGSEAYAYDPKNPVPTIGGGNLILGGKGPLDQQEIGDREDYLRFETDVLESPVEVVGRVTADLYVESDAPDTDFVAKLVDVYPDGYEALITDGILRMRYRDGLDHEVMMEPGQVVRARVDLWSTAIVFNKGHRIALHVTSSNDPRFDPNPNTGHAQRADSETRVANNTIHFSQLYPSRLLLPIVHPSTDDE
ncbi:MAG: CocE/NonD family hydrolase [Planctomycetaceae bacterium]|nr:CocE/NonD family hydrolase [Planctomycetaceae bacterium]